MLLRIVRFPLTLMVLGFFVFAALYSASAVFIRSHAVLKNGPAGAAVMLASAALGLGLWRVFQQVVEGRRDGELTFAGAPAELGRGIGLGLVLFSAVAALTALLGGIAITGLGSGAGFWPMLSMAIGSAFYEEVMFRAVAFRQLEALLGSWAALALTSLLFGAAHIENGGATWFSCLAIAVEAGILLGAAFMLTRRLWLAMGIHAGWNFTQGWVFALPVSGSGGGAGLLATSRSGPEWLSGGAFGLEAGVPALVLASLAGLVLLYRAALQGQVRPPALLRSGR